jgi:hypothetical protein
MMATVLRTRRFDRSHRRVTTTTIATVLARTCAIAPNDAT